jgi:hypothetical protein
MLGPPAPPGRTYGFELLENNFRKSRRICLTTLSFGYFLPFNE